MANLFYGHIRSQDVKLHYSRTAGEKPPVVLLHGFSDNGLCWGSLALALEPVYDVIMPDARGHGLSEAPKIGTSYSYDDYSSDVVTLIHDLKLKTPRIIGHSMGAQTAAVLAAQYPELIGGIILEDPPFLENQQTGVSETQEERAETARKQLASMKGKPFNELLALCQAKHPLWNEEDQFQWAKAKQQVDPLVANGTTLPRTPWREVIQNITCPTLVITGDPECGALITPSISTELTVLSKFVKIHQIPGAGHSIRREQFINYLAAVKDFLKKGNG
jgi:pimeloyl-ACP methyl ester carboxylesterase